VLNASRHLFVSRSWLVVQRNHSARILRRGCSPTVKVSDKLVGLGRQVNWRSVAGNRDSDFDFHGRGFRVACAQTMIGGCTYELGEYHHRLASEGGLGNG
jgi:hypothetical protein